MKVKVDKKHPSRGLLKAIRKSLDQAKADDNLITLVPRLRTLVEGIVVYLEFRRKGK
jgi:CRISPR/Cas system CSM-associated protein Csm2 small subunit